MSVSLVQAIWTVIAFVIFVGIVIWAWSDNRKDDFEKASRMALDDDEPPHEAKQDSDMRGHHG